MKRFNYKTLLIPALFAFVVLFSGCESKDPSILKIFVRSANNELQSNAKVVIIGDVNSNPPTNAYVDTVMTNESGFASFNMDDYFANSGDNTTGYFDLIITKDVYEAEGRVRCRKHITTVETVFFPN